jgi:tryptophan halogenase
MCRRTLTIFLVACLWSAHGMAMNVDSLWDYSNPQASEKRFREALEAEPLEATSIHATITQMHLLALNLRPGKPDSWDLLSRAYNRAINEILDNIRDYLALHYLSDRADSEYWRTLRRREFVPDSLREKLDLWQYRFPSDLDFSGTHDLVSFAMPSYLFVLDGLGLLPPRLADAKLLQKHEAQLASLDASQSAHTLRIAAAALDHREILDLATGLP